MPYHLYFHIVSSNHHVQNLEPTMNTYPSAAQLDKGNTTLIYAIQCEGMLMIQLCQKGFFEAFQQKCFNKKHFFTCLVFGVWLYIIWNHLLDVFGPNRPGSNYGRTKFIFLKLSIENKGFKIISTIIC